MYRVIKEFYIVDKNTNYTYEFPIDTEIEYQRISNRTIRIASDEYPYPIDSNMECENFDIENFVESIEETPLFKMNREIQQSVKEQEEYTRIFNLGLETGKSMKEEEPYTVQVEMRSSRHDLNKYLKTIPGKNIINIKPIENNCYLVIYKEFTNEDNKD